MTARPARASRRKPRFGVRAGVQAKSPLTTGPGGVSVAWTRGRRQSGRWDRLVLGSFRVAATSRGGPGQAAHLARGRGDRAAHAGSGAPAHALPRGSWVEAGLRAKVPCRPRAPWVGLGRASLPGLTRFRGGAPVFSLQNHPRNAAASTPGRASRLRRRRRRACHPSPAARTPARRVRRSRTRASG